ncbi:HWE histidine kinase domain-containing protein [Roseicella aquatilis]|uniref:histidine kinase n=1 Tax=Roseicella aquatilis TaxID=2527868 RepID=A0A4V2WM80_9PROT|nr:HWE histidine kinase domain-containing protein [Roseicella aquatilis]TCZ66830.1 HAMP domain-containing protein [Roseicella aquatilis]
MSLLARLLALVLLATLPALGLQVWREVETNRERRASVAEAARTLALRAAIEQERLIDGARQLLGAMVSLRSVRTRDIETCTDSLRRIRAEFPAYAAISAAGVPDGVVFCSSNNPGNTVSDRAWFRDALAQGGFILGEQVTSRETGRRVMHFARPALDEDGRISAVLNAALDLDQMMQTLAQGPLPPGATLLVADRNGVVLASLPDRQLVGAPLPPALAPLLARRRADVAEIEWAGARRITAYEPAGASPAYGLLVVVGLDRESALAEAEHRARVALLGTILAALVALGIALWFAVRFIRRPITQLAAAAARWQAGDLSARAGLSDRSELGRLAAAFDAMAAAVEAREAELRRGMARSEAEQARFRALFAAAPMATALVDPVTLELVAFNDLACSLLGYSRVALSGLRLTAIDADHDEAALCALGRDVSPGPRTFETRHRLSSGAIRDVLVSCERVQVDGRWLIYAAWLDVTEQRQAETRERLLLREVDHRARNALAVVRALLQLSPRDLAPQDFARTLDGRIAAMARAHALLAADRWQGASLEQLVTEELAAFAGPQGGNRVRLEGPSIRLSAEIAQPLSLVLHELATNAAKHGALSCEAGTLRLDWRLDGEGCLCLGWTECGGPPVAGPPERQGFGSRLVERVTRAQLRGEVRFTWAPEGLALSLVLPLKPKPRALPAEAAPAGCAAR